MKTKTVFLVVFLSVAQLGHAHNPHLATFYIRQLEALWVIEGSFPQFGLHEAMKKHYSDVDLDNVEQAEYKRLAIAYIKSHVDIETTSGRKIELGEGGLRLGSHQTDVRFILTNLPETPENLSVSITCLSENDHHNNILRAPVVDGGQFILNNENQFSAELNFGIGPHLITNHYKTEWMLGVLTLIMLALIVVLLRSKMKELLVNV